jgi:uncharacterized protein
VWLTVNSHRRPTIALLFVCLAAHDSELRRQTGGVDRRIRQTFAASPAEPGELPLGFRRNYIKSARISIALDGYRILQLSDLHVELSEDAIVRSSTLLQEIDYDVCVLTGDYRAQAFGPFEAALRGMSQFCAKLKQPIYGVLGNHDTVRMLPGLERMGIRMLLNECEVINRDDQCIYIAGIDDAHFYRADNLEKAASGIPSNEFSILLSHTPKIYQQAAHADFNLLLSGHTHGGQICLPGRIPLTLDSVLPRSMGAGAWRYREMHGYTSVGLVAPVIDHDGNF